MIVRRPRRSTDDRATAPPLRPPISSPSYADPAVRAVIVRRPPCSRSDRAMVPPFDRSSYNDPVVRPMISSSSSDGPVVRATISSSSYDGPASSRGDRPTAPPLRAMIVRPPRRSRPDLIVFVRPPCSSHDDRESCRGGFCSWYLRQGRLANIGRAVGSAHEDDEIRARTAGRPHDHRTKRRGRRTITARSGGGGARSSGVRRGQLAIIGRAAGPAHEGDEIRARTTGPAHDHRACGGVGARSGGSQRRDVLRSGARSGAGAR